MKYILKPIVSDILVVIEAALLFLITAMFILKFTLLNEKYIIKSLNKTDYYEIVFNETKDTMQYIARKSELKEKFIEDTFTIENVKNDTAEFIKSVYKGKAAEINTEMLKENLNRKIESYEEEKKLTIDEELKTNFINKITSTYKNEITLMNSLEKQFHTLYKYKKLNNTLLILFIFDLITLTIINKRIFRKKEYNVVLSSTILSLTITYICLKTINLKNLFIYNNNVSSVLKEIIKKSINIVIIFLIAYIILEIIMKKKKKLFIN